MTASAHPRAARATAALLAGALAVLPALGAGAAEGPGDGTEPPADPGSLTWAVGPVDRDGRSRALFEYYVSPGDVITDSLRVRVIGADPIDFGIYGSDALLSENGVFDVLPAARPSRDVGAWVAMAQDRVRVEGDQGVEVPFTLTVPENATPGDHVGGIVTSVSSQVDADRAGSVRLDRRLGSRIYLRVGGALAPGLTISPPKVSYSASANPFGGSTSVSYTITNSGNTRLQARRKVRVNGLLGGASTAKDLPELLPGSMLSFTETVAGPRVFGPANAKVSLEPRDQLAGELPTSAFAPTAASAGVWALPWSQLVLLVLALAGAGYAAVRHRRRAAPEDATDPHRPSVPAAAE